MVKDHSDNKKEISLLPLHGLLFAINSKGSFNMHHPPSRIAHTTAFVTPVVRVIMEFNVAAGSFTHLRRSNSNYLTICMKNMPKKCS